MTSELFISVRPQKIAIALTEDKRLAEYQEEGQSERFNVGNIYLGKVRKLMPGLNACFINVGAERDAFLHYGDMGAHFNTQQRYLKRVLSDRKNLIPISTMTAQEEPVKDGNIQNVLKQGQEVLVQIVKEPISTKGPRMTGELSFPGRLLVLMPFGDKVNISSKIKSSAERARLKQTIQSILPQGFSVIVRTVAEGKRTEELESELKLLISKWESAMQRVMKVKELPSLVAEEESRAVGLLRDLFNPSYENIYVDNEEVFKEVQSYVSTIAPERVNVVKYYRGNLPIFDNFDITRQIKSSFGKTVSYKHGAYLIIEHTEALHVVDVNSGNRAKAENGQEANALEVNLGAADELARQLRLRDMGGIIVVDFIDMHLAEDRQKLYERMCENMKSDRAKHNILPLSKFGLMQITRQRVRPAMEVKVDETCPTCHGQGTIKSSLLFADMLENKIEILTKNLGIKRFKLQVHPYVYAYLNQGLLTRRLLWKFRYGFGVSVVPNQMFSFLQYQFLDSNGNEIDMKEEQEIK